MKGTTIRLARVEYAGEIAAIYSYFVLDTPVSFESEAPDVEETGRRIAKIIVEYPWLVCESEGRVAGYAYASRHRERFHYQWSVDVSVYVHNDFRRQGIGKALYTALLGVLPLQGFVSAYAGITLPNEGSVGLHEAMGFVPVGVYRNVGFKLGKWHDVGWWQRTLQEPPAEPSNPIGISEIVGTSGWESVIRSGAELFEIR